MTNVWSDVVGQELHLTGEDVDGLRPGESACLLVSWACREGADQVRLAGRWATPAGEVWQDNRVLIPIDFVLAHIRQGETS